MSDMTDAWAYMTRYLYPDPWPRVYLGEWKYEKMNKFKEGDRVVVLASNYASGSPHTPSQDTIGLHGVITNVDVNDECPYYVKFDNGRGGVSYVEKDLRLEELTMENVQKGDVLLNSCCNEEVTVIERIGDLVFLSEENRPEVSECYVHVKQLEDEGYSLVKEVTKEEIAEKFGVDVAKLRVKD